jgi:hypothetical protein
VEVEREQPPRQDLVGAAAWAEASGRRVRELGAPFQRNLARGETQRSIGAVKKSFSFLSNSEQELIDSDVGAEEAHDASLRERELANRNCVPAIGL